MHAVASTSLKKALRWGLIPTNPTEATDAPRHVPTRQSQVLTLEEATRLLQRILAWREDRYALFLLAISTGMRQGEILGLRWSDLNLATGELSIRRQADTHVGAPRFDTPKSGRQRSVVLSGMVLDALKVHKKKQREEILRAAVWKDKNLIFTGPTGDVIRKSVLYGSFKAFLKREGFPDISFHELRHSAATILLEDGEGMRSVSDLLGHADVGITLRVYGHLTERMKKSPAERMDKLLGGG